MLNPLVYLDAKKHNRKRTRRKTCAYRMSVFGALYLALGELTGLFNINVTGPPGTLAKAHCLLFPEYFFLISVLVLDFSGSGSGIDTNSLLATRYTDPAIITTSRKQHA